MTDKLLELELESLKDGLLFSGRFYKKPIVIFNSASQCGFTEQFAEFQTMYQEGNIVPIALPTNEFGAQEPHTHTHTRARARARAHTHTHAHLTTVVENTFAGVAVSTGSPRLLERGSCLCLSIPFYFDSIYGPLLLLN